MSLAFELRPAAKSDLGFCWPIYRDAMKPLTEALSPWNEPAQQKIVEEAITHAGTSIMRSNQADVGWLQVEETKNVVMLKQIFLLPTARNRGLGTSFLKWMQERADRKRKDLTLDVANRLGNLISERTRDAFAYMREAGLKTNGLPLGMKAIPEGRHQRLAWDYDVLEQLVLLASMRTGGASPSAFPL